MKIEIKQRTFKYKKRDEICHEVFIDDKPLNMGEGVGELVEGHCEHHGNTKFLYGYNQGGHDGVGVCLKCCQEIATCYNL